MTIHPLWKLLLVVSAYLLGSIPFGLILARAASGVDVRAVGSGNIGASNVARSAGRWVGVLTLVLDAAKGALPLLIAIGLLVPEGAMGTDRWIVAVGLAAFFGHLFPVWLGFRGGKGVATGLGVFAVLAPVAALAGVVAFAIAFAATRIASVGSLAGTAVCTAGIFLRYGAGSPISWAGLVIAVAIVAKHRSNIARLLQHAEHKV